MRDDIEAGELNFEKLSTNHCRSGDPFGLSSLGRLSFSNILFEPLS